MPHNAAGAHCMRNSRHRSVNRRACETHRPAAHPARWKWRITGRPLSALQNASSPALPFELKTFAIVPADRAQLHQRIAARFDSLLKAGLIEEVKALRMRYELSAGLPSMRAVGYRQVWEYLEGAYGHEALREKGIAATRQLAKRQMTWLRSLRARYDILDPVDAAAQFAARLRVGQRRIAGRITRFNVLGQPVPDRLEAFDSGSARGHRKSERLDPLFALYFSRVMPTFAACRSNVATLSHPAAIAVQVTDNRRSPPCPTRKAQRLPRSLGVLHHQLPDAQDSAHDVRHLLPGCAVETLAHRRLPRARPAPRTPVRPHCTLSR